MGSIDDGANTLSTQHLLPRLPLHFLGFKRYYIFNFALLRLHSSTLAHIFQALSLSNTYKYARGLSARTLSASARTTFSSLKRTQESPPSLSVRMWAT